MNYFTVMLEQGKCIEVCQSGGVDEGTMLGYAIFFSGSWDGWRVVPGGMKRVACDMATPDEAIAEIVK